MPAKKTSKSVGSSKTSKVTKKEAVVEKKTVAKKTVQKGGAKKQASKKEVSKKNSKAKATPAKKEVASTPSVDKSVRSFKVMLPGTDNFVGRFTGLTPYQAANKALSKYYRETKKAKAQIQFSIRESTRGSKRSTYTYNGARDKLDEPVEYTISNSDGQDRTIVKKFKNRLTKVKKSELAEAKN